MSAARYEVVRNGRKFEVSNGLEMCSVGEHVIQENLASVLRPSIRFVFLVPLFVFPQWPIPPRGHACAHMRGRGSLPRGTHIALLPPPSATGGQPFSHPMFKHALHSKPHTHVLLECFLLRHQTHTVVSVPV